MGTDQGQIPQEYLSSELKVLGYSQLPNQAHSSIAHLK